MGFNSAFKGLKLLKKTRERAFKQFKQFKWPRPQCVKKPNPDTAEYQSYALHCLAMLFWFMNHLNGHTACVAC